ncbi:MAG: type I-D CRISPR-associated helicase Cas3' [Elainellaceae cyanobacterium]
MDYLRLELEPRSIASCPNPNMPANLVKAFPYGVLQHQDDVYEAAQDHDIILDLAPTGTGKTSAGLSVIAHNRDRNAVYIAPTNALVEQQTEAAKVFVQAAGLPHIVKAAAARDIKAWPDDKVGRRSGEKLYNVLRQPATLFPECAGRPVLLVTNPDIFYYATFFSYSQLDRDNIASVFYNSFSTVIFDEFHLYDAKQLVSLLFYLAVSHVFGYFQAQRKVVLLTATPEPACEAALGQLEAAGVNVKCIHGETITPSMLPSQTSVNLEIRKHADKKRLMTEVTDEVVRRLQEHPDHFGAVILDSLDYINQLNKQLRDAGLQESCGRITGVIKSSHERQCAAQTQVSLATRTVDVGFNFDRDETPNRQSLDWLIFSSRDRFSFWQRLGRVGRVLGRQETNNASEAIAYLPEKAWEEGLGDLDCSGGREALRYTLERIDCMKRPFLDIYWQSEAFLEIARPLLELEALFEHLPQASLINQLYQNLQSILGGKRDWSYYRQRMQAIKGAESISSKTIKELQKDWKYVKGGQSCVRSFLRAVCPEDWEDLQAGRLSIETVEGMIQNDQELAKDLKAYAAILQASYAPLFKFRNSLFDSLTIHDPKCLLLDEKGETLLDPIHLLRFYEFEVGGDRIEVTCGAQEPYQLAFSLNIEDLDEFKNVYLNKLYAFENCHITRMQGDMIRPTPLVIEKTLIPGVVISKSAQNSWAVARLRKQGLDCYPIRVSDSSTSKDYLFFPSLAGILAIASAGIRLKCTDDEEFWIA